MKKNLVKTQEQNHGDVDKKPQIICIEEGSSWKLKFKNQIAILHLISSW